MKNQPFIGPLAGLMLGILLADKLSPISSSIKIAVLIILGILLVVFWRKKIFPILVVSVFVLLGWSRFENHNQTRTLSDNLTNKEISIQLKVTNNFRSSKDFHKYKAEILSIDSVEIKYAYTLLYLRKENSKLYDGDIVWVNSKLLNNPKPKNPHQFDYSKYLERKKIHYTLFTDTVFNKISNLNSSDYFSSKFKNKVHQKLLESGYNQQTTDQISAMLLGDRTEMDKDLEESYRKTGVVHILAISGLHVMMVYSIFYFLLFPVSQLKNGKQIRILLSLFLIWSFVLLVGFHPPVLRSALMIFVFHIAVAFKRQPNVYHSLAVSAFILLLFNPNFLFEVGFQLSYSAVFFIVYLHPIYQKLFRPKTKYSRFIIGFVGTCISAQLGTLPFSVFYFNQTSALFLAGNVVMIGAAYVMIAGGMFSVLLVELGIDFQLWTKFFNQFISACNAYIHQLSGFEFLVFDTVTFNIWEVVLILIGLLFLKTIVSQPKSKYTMLGLGLIVLFQAQRIFNNYQLLQKQEIIVFHQNRNSVIGIRNGNELDVFISDAADLNSIKTYLIRPYIVQQKIRKVQYLDMKSNHESFYQKSEDFISFNGKQLQLINDQSADLKADFLLIQHNADWNQEWMLQANHIILDGSNYPQYNSDVSNLWETRTDGAFIIQLK